MKQLCRRPLAVSPAVLLFFSFSSSALAKNTVKQFSNVTAPQFYLFFSDIDTGGGTSVWDFYQ